MKHLLTRGAIVAIVAIVLCTGSAQAQYDDPNWPEVFEPNQLLTFYMTIDPCDWAFIVREVSPTVDPKTYTEFPAMLWAEGETAVLVGVRKKSCVTLPLPGYTIPGDANLIDPNKVKISLKIDINQYYPEEPNAVTEWHGQKKISLENGGTTGVQAEGLACNIHRMASATEGYGYDNWRASWIKLYVNGVYRGVYTNNEQIDKQFLRHRGIYVSHASWLYKSWGSGALQLKVGDDTFPYSPALNALCYKPFPCLDEDSPIYIGEDLCNAPNDVNLVDDMNEWVNMQGMLALGAVNTFLANHDAIFGANGHNFYCFDFNLPEPGETRKRMYFPWDNDGGFASTDYGIDENSEGAGADSYAGLILGHPTFRSHFNQILKDLLNGPLSAANISAFIDDVNTSELRAAIIADPWNQVGGNPAGKFAELKTWISDRIPNVLAQIDYDEPEVPGVVLLDDGFDDGLGGVAWNANWTGSWIKDTTTYAHGRPSAFAESGSGGAFASVGLDANDAIAIHIDFKFQKKGTEAADFTLSYYNGTSYIDANELDTLGADNVWLRYTDTITDSNYFIPDFRIQFDATLSGGENVWVDDVVITKEIPTGTPCDAANLDGTGLVNFEDYAIFAPDWRQSGSGLAGDVDANDVVNFADLAQIALYWLDDCQP